MYKQNLDYLNTSPFTELILLEIPFFVYCNKTVEIAHYIKWVHHKAAQLIEI